MEAVQTITIRVFIIVLSVVLIGMLLGTISKAFIFNTDNSYGAVAKRIGQKISYVASTDSDYSGDWIELPHADFGVAITKDGVKIKSSEGTEIIKPLHYTGDLVIQEFPKEGGFAVWSTRGALTRNVLDTARFLDVAAGPDDRDRQSLPAFNGSFEHAADHLDVAGLRAVYSPDIGYAVVEPEVEAIARRAAEKLIATADLAEVSRPVNLTNIYNAWGAVMLGPLYQDWKKAGIWPDKADLFKRVKDHDRAEAALIALYGLKFEWSHVLVEKSFSNEEIDPRTDGLPI